MSDLEMQNPITSITSSEALAALQQLLNLFDNAVIDARTLTPARRKQVQAKVSLLIAELERIGTASSLVQMPPVVLDPSEPHVIGKLIVDVLLVQERYPLASVPRFFGSGVYALYYKGDFDAYTPASRTETPLYVGKADPAVPNANNPIEQGEKLATRLNDHKRSINAVDNLDVSDFDCRFLVVKSAWQNTAETYLINGFQPVWNDEVGICFGIGKHGDSALTRRNTRSPWDTLHPGRAWAWAPNNTPNPLSANEIKTTILAHYEKHPPKSVSRLPTGAAPDFVDVESGEIGS